MQKTDTKAPSRATTIGVARMKAAEDTARERVVNEMADTKWGGVAEMVVKLYLKYFHEALEEAK